MCNHTDITRKTHVYTRIARERVTLSQKKSEENDMWIQSQNKQIIYNIDKSCAIAIRKEKNIEIEIGINTDSSCSHLLGHYATPERTKSVFNGLLAAIYTGEKGFGMPKE